MANGALDGITVLDLTRGMAGALATMFLCDYGARVIRIDAPATDRARESPSYLAWDRGKESIVLDFLDEADQGRSPLPATDLAAGELPDGVRAFRELLGTADVLVESFPPSSPYQSLLDFKSLTSLNPRLVHCSITAYGKHGPLKDEPANDELVMARTGILTCQATFRPGPFHVLHPVPSVGAGILAAQGTVAALFSREKTGRGRRVETSLMAGALLFAPKVAGEKFSPSPMQLGPAGGSPFYSLFECADGTWIQLGCIHSGFVDMATAVMGIGDVLADPRFGDGRMPSSEEARKELFDIVAGVIRTRPCAEWAKLFEEADVPFARSNDIGEAVEDPQVRFSGAVIELDDPEVGKVSQMGPPITLSETPGKVKGPRAVPGQHTARVLSDLPGEGRQAGRLPPRHQGPLGPPLAGVKVLEITNVIAGPATGRLLSDMGADVTKMEPLDGEISRAAGREYFVYLNCNKRSLAVNTRTPEGREVTRRLAAEADILLANMRPGATERMGIGTDALKSLNPGLIETHITAYGHIGPYAHRPGVDPLAQALMGLQRAQGGPANPPVYLGKLAPTDFTAGALGALGVVMALFVRERTGTAQRVDTNLLSGATVLGSELFTRYEGRPPHRLPDKGQHGLGALHRLYETEDGWIYLVAEAQDAWLALCKALGRDDMAQDSRFASASARAKADAALSMEMARTFAVAGSKEWLSQLKAAGVPCAPAVDVEAPEFFADPHVDANDMAETHEHPTWGRLTLSRNGLKFCDTADINARPTPLLGQHTTEVLQELGLAPSQIAALYDSGVVYSQGHPAGE